MIAAPTTAQDSAPFSPRSLPSEAGIDSLADQIAELSAHIQAATYRLLTLIREFDLREGWGVQGANSCAQWLSWRVGLDMGAAREKVRVARALGDLPLIGAALERGEISYSKVRALTRVATPENEEELLGFARAGTAAHVERLVRAWRRVDRLEEAEIAERRRSSRTLQAYTDEDGMVVVRARLEPEAGAMLLQALEAAEDKLYRSNQEADSESGVSPGPPEPETDAVQRRADALALVAESALGSGLDGAEFTTGGDHHQIVVHVDAVALVEGSQRGQAVLDGGTHVSAETSRRLSCDASKVEMRHARDGTLLDVGRKTRTVPPAIRRALAFRDRNCRFPGCGAKICDAHHVEHWADGGATKLSNLILLCRRHHRAVHEEGFRLLLRRDGSAEFFTGSGRRIEESPSAPKLSRRPVALLRHEHAKRGITIDASTAIPTGDGGPFDLNWAVSGFRAMGEGRRAGRFAAGDVSAET